MVTSFSMDGSLGSPENSCLQKFMRLKVLYIYVILHKNAGHDTWWDVRSKHHQQGLTEKPSRSNGEQTSEESYRRLRWWGKWLWWGSFCFHILSVVYSMNELYGHYSPAWLIQLKQFRWNKMILQYCDQYGLFFSFGFLFQFSSWSVWPLSWSCGPMH